MARIRIDVLPSACLMGALLLLALPLRWVLAWVMAAGIHELSHIAAICLCKGRIRHIRIGPIGASIAIAPMGPGAEAVCALAGPVGGLCTVLFFRWIPCTALFAFLQTAYNLLPLYPLDGGRALRCLLEMAAGPERAEKASNVCNLLTLLALLALGIFAWIRWHLGILLLLVPILLLLKFLPRKIPCKRRPLGLQ